MLEAKPSCSGRSFHVKTGSPLVNPRTKKLIGIVSDNPWVLRGYPIRLFRISDFIEWIESVIGPKAGKTPGQSTELLIPEA